MPAPKALVWVDLETTGTDENENAIVEVALIITNLELIERATLQSLVDPRVIHPIDAWSDFIVGMHTESGLMADLDERIAAGICPTLVDVNKSIETLFVIDHDETGLRPHHYLLAGSGVSHFDRRFIKQYLPALEKMLQYPNLDVGSTRRELQILGFDDLIPPFNDGKTHRAMDDVRCHLAELRDRREMWATLRAARAAREIDVLVAGPPDGTKATNNSPELIGVFDVVTGQPSQAGSWRQTHPGLDNWALRLRHLPSSADKPTPAETGTYVVGEPSG